MLPKYKNSATSLQLNDDNTKLSLFGLGFLYLFKFFAIFFRQVFKKLFLLWLTFCIF